MKKFIFTLCCLPSIALAQPFQGLQGLEGLQGLGTLSNPLQPQLALPVPQPAAPNGYAIIERDRPLPLFQLDDENRTYRSYKVIPLDRNGQLSQPAITNQEYLNDLIWSAGRKKR
jgi:hypothetical protein